MAQHAEIRGMPDSARSSLDQNSIVVKELSRYLGRRTNNVAEYPGLLIGLEALPQLKKNTVVQSDSQLMVRQLTTSTESKTKNSKNYFAAP
jgi:ribonuclease HI